MTSHLNNGSACFICGDPLTAENDSREHVIPRAIGGRLRTRGFICVKCNSVSGETWDAEAAEQLNALSLFFVISREGNAPPSQKVKTVSGQELLLRPDGRLDMTKPSIEVRKTDAGKELRVSTRNEREARQVLEGLKRTYPEIDVEAILQAAQTTYTPPDGPVTFSVEFGGAGAGRSVVKSAAAYASYCGLDASLFKTAKNYLDDAAAEPPFGYYHDTDLVIGRPKGIPIHCVALKGDPETGLLLGYVEYFGFQRMVVCLSDAYEGERINHSYGIDPLTGKAVDLQIDLPFNKADLAAIYNYERLPIETMKQAFGDVIPTGMRRQAEAEQARAFAEAINYGFRNCGAEPGAELTVDQIKKLSGLVVEKLTPYLVRMVASRPRPLVIPADENQDEGGA